MAKKKETAKQRRQANEAKRQEKIQLINAQKNAEEQRILEEKLRAEELRLKELVEKFTAENSDSGKKEKSKAKIAGLKTLYTVSEGKMTAASFGRGNSACREVNIENGEISDIIAAPSISVSPIPEEKKFQVSGRAGAVARPDNPQNSSKKSGDDLVYLRSEHEKLFFGKNFDDNLHIQVAYNILDIAKVLSVFSNNIVFELNNMLRATSDETGDVMGSMGYERTYDELKQKNYPYELYKKLLFKPQLGYFGNVLLAFDGDGKLLAADADENIWEAHRRRVYYLLATLAMVRQATAHGDLKQRSMIYNLETVPTGTDTTSVCIREARKELDKLYSDRVKELNRGFFDKSGKKDLSIAFKAMNAQSEEDRRKVACEYFRFIVIKEYKNLGFSIKRLRETMIGMDAAHLAHEDYDTFRHKMNHLVDFLIVQHYKKTENSKHSENMVEKLRSCSDAQEKTLIYMEEAKRVWNAIGDRVDSCILPYMSEKGLERIDKVSMDESVLDSIAVSDNVHGFSKMVYLMTLFLDGKEINDLLTQLINRFDNIASFLDLMKEEKLECSFAKDYKLLEDSAGIVEELRVINSFARMSKEDAAAKAEMFVEAAEVLGYTESEEDLRQYAKKVFDKKQGLKKRDGSKDNGFRNFIINNVITSDRFKYLIRYGNPKRVKDLTVNRTVIAFVLKDIPDEQIRFYYNSCKGVRREYFPEMRDHLADIIQNLNFSDFDYMANNSSESSDWEKDKELKKNIVRLYLTVLYLLQKNLVNVNSRYYMAFHCVERDAYLCDFARYGTKVRGKTLLDSDKGAYARDFLQAHPNRSRRYLDQNFANADVESWNFYRNCVEHLNVVRDTYRYIGDIREFKSYFELYHYLVQRYIMDKYGERTPGGKLPVYFNMVSRYKTFCKDFVKALNMPFAYNLPRYKNLSINELFDRNHYLKDRKKMYEELKNDD